MKAIGPTPASRTQRSSSSLSISSSPSRQRSILEIATTARYRAITRAYDGQR
jgi:hypothetical protein